MKKSVTLFTLVFCSILFTAQEDILALNLNATIEWKETTFDFGDVPMNEPISVEFTFSNPGMIPLIISDVKPSCGCTVADFPRQPISSGNSGTIKVTFDAKTPGYFSKTITVYTNSTDGHTNLYIKGTVVKK